MALYSLSSHAVLLWPGPAFMSQDINRAMAIAQPLVDSLHLGFGSVVIQMKAVVVVAAMGMAAGAAVHVDVSVDVVVVVVVVLLVVVVVVVVVPDVIASLDVV